MHTSDETNENAKGLIASRGCNGGRPGTIISYSISNAVGVNIHTPLSVDSVIIYDSWCKLGKVRNFSTLTIKVATHPSVLITQENDEIQSQYES